MIGLSEKVNFDKDLMEMREFSKGIPGARVWQADSEVRTYLMCLMNGKEATVAFGG